MSKQSNLLIINGSFRNNSLTGVFAQILASIAQPNFLVSHISVRTLNLPNFDYDVVNHPQAKVLREAILNAEGILIISPEYHGCVSGALKNALDFIQHELAGKPVGVLATAGSSKSGTNAMNTLRTICRSLRSHVLIEQVSLSKEELTENKHLNQKLQLRCESLLLEMQEAIEYHHTKLVCQSRPKVALA